MLDVCLRVFLFVSVIASFCLTVLVLSVCLAISHTHISCYKHKTVWRHLRPEIDCYLLV